MGKEKVKTLIIGVSGKKQSGKTSLCDHLAQTYRLDWWPPKMVAGYNHLLGSYSFADPLKTNVCMDVLGLTHAQCYETDEDKNTSTQYLWDNLPDNIRYKNAIETERVLNAGVEGGYMEIPIMREGPMKAREIMQVVGTDVFRNFFDQDIWVNTTLRNIEQDDIAVAIISDVRFPGEVRGIVKQGGCIIRLARDVCEKDSHSSESALDDYDFESLGDRAIVINNQDMDAEEKNGEAIRFLKGLKEK